MRKSVAIIGSGVAGLSAAFKLRNRNIKTTVFEKSDTIGGRTKTSKKIIVYTVMEQTILKRKK